MRSEYYLDTAAAGLEQMQPIVSLECLVGELCKRKPNLGLYPRLDARPPQHSPHPEIASDTTEEVYDVHLAVPITVIHYLNV